MNLNSEKVIVNQPQKQFFEFLTNLNNFEQLMPSTIEKFEVDGDSFLFGIAGMPEIRLVIAEKTEYGHIKLKAASSKLDFSLVTTLKEVSANSCECQLLFEGDFNPMMAMMVKKPLQKFLDTLAEKAATL
jgi:carbon monoxide dehydrogenase subunit G